MAKTAQGIEDSLHTVNNEISEMLGEIAPEVFDFSKFPFSFMGKAVRARFTLLVGDALNLNRRKTEKIAAAAELTHTASLLHDDCIDRARYRRGFPTLNKNIGINAAILVGDLIVPLAFDFAAGAAPALAPELMRAVKRMTEGALLEENSRGKKISPPEAERIAALKTGALFRWCALAACSLSGRRGLLESCAEIGGQTGAAFQIIDDVLDFEGDLRVCGKENLKDISEGKFTLPLILALNDAAAGPRAEELLSVLKKGPAMDVSPLAFAPVRGSDGDLDPVFELAALVKEGGFAAAARASAFKKLKALFPLIETLPNREAAAELKCFLLSLGERKA